MNVIEQNRPFGSFPRILARLDEVIINFLHKQWHEALNENQLEKIRKFILEYLNLDGLPAVEENPPKNPPMLKIRGLLHRDRGETNSKALVKKLEIQF